MTVSCCAVNTDNYPHSTDHWTVYFLNFCKPQEFFSADFMRAPKQTDTVLHCHPETLCSAVASLTTAITWLPGKFLNFVYTVKGAIGRLRLPPFESLRRGDSLWQQTCFEAFIGAKNDAEYYEFNFSPSGEWAAYAFRAYRDGSAYTSDGFEPKIVAARGEDIFELSAAIDLDRFPELKGEVQLCVGISTVIETLDGSLSYWALRHPPGRPDFHHSESFALELEPVVRDASARDPSHA